MSLFSCVGYNQSDVKEIIKNSGVYVSSGGGGWGIMQSFYIGELIKNMITIKQ